MKEGTKLEGKILLLGLCFFCCKIKNCTFYRVQMNWTKICWRESMEMERSTLYHQKYGTVTFCEWQFALATLSPKTSSSPGKRFGLSLTMLLLRAGLVTDNYWAYLFRVSFFFSLVLVWQISVDIYVYFVMLCILDTTF